jgi:hypothetical protein
VDAKWSSWQTCKPEMATELRLNGVDELLAELTSLAPDLAAETGPLELAIAEETAENLRTSYPVVSGELAGSVQVERASSSSPARVFARVVVRSPHAEFFEFGTSRMGPSPTFVPISRRGREAFVRAVIDRVRARGLEVSGA